jgi:hypothetical protein
MAVGRKSTPPRSEEENGLSLEPRSDKTAWSDGIITLLCDRHAQAAFERCDEQLRYARCMRAWVAAGSTMIRR